MEACNLYPIGDGSEHWGRPGSLGKYGMIDWLRSQAAKICSADQTEKQNTEREGLGGHLESLNLETSSLVRCLHLFIDVVGSHCGDMRVMGLVADPETGH